MSRYEEVMQEILNEYRGSIERKFNDYILSDSIDETESEIEKIMYVQIMNDIIINDDIPSKLTPQYKIKKDESYIRVDFLLEIFDERDEMNNVKIIIEYDGHNFHEKTKEQAKKDKSRDRFLLNNGYYVLRFTGSEIYQNPRKCVQEIEDLIIKKLYGKEIESI